MLSVVCVPTKTVPSATARAKVLKKCVSTQNSQQMGVPASKVANRSSPAARAFVAGGGP